MRITRDQLVEWAHAHGLNPLMVKSMTITFTDEELTGRFVHRTEDFAVSLEAVVYKPDENGNKYFDPVLNDAVTETVTVPMRSFPR